MPSQLDLDQGGTFRQYQEVWLGPSLGWQTVPQEAVFPITAIGTYAISRGTNLITINANANVTINLPFSIVDIGGFASANTYTINPSGAELISGLASIRLASNFGAFLLKPILETGGWTLLQ